MKNINLITILVFFIDLFCIICSYIRLLCKKCSLFNNLFFSIYLQQNESIFTYNNKFYYKLNNYIKKGDLLDIGCNKGIIYELFPNIDYIGIDTNSKFCKPYIITENFENYEPNKKFDHIILFAVHDYLKLTAKQLVNKLLSLLNNNGILYFKSHQEPDQKLNEIINYLSNNKQIIKIYDETVYLKCELHKRQLVYFQYIKE